jgi:dihydrofolate reductase
LINRKIVLYIALSLDGFIARMDGSVDWLLGESQDPDVDTGYPDFLATVDTILMGWTTYYQLITELSPDQWVYEGKQCYVASTRPHEKQEHVEIISGDIPQFTHHLLERPGKDIWLVGGSELVAPFIEEDLIDEYILTFIPTLLGSGIPLFKGSTRPINLHLKDTRSFDGMVQLIYSRQTSNS